ncbi:MAG TPA: TIGR01212 family radical SAM protein [bacterium]|nr:TIGR01212 family radical SAM protein [bacterium]
MSDKRYYAFSDYLKGRFGCKVYKISIDAGFTCPNRDGSMGEGGCIYCNNQGFSPNTRRERASISEQTRRGAEFMRARYKAEKFLAYFQAFTNTYAPLDTLRRSYSEALACEDIVGLSVGTRPDCVPDDVLDLLASIGQNKETWIELGLQSAHDRTLELINRRHNVASFIDASRRAIDRGSLKICGHIILGLPGETRDMMLDSARLLSNLGVHGVKIHLLHILKDTPLADAHSRGEIPVFKFEEYVSLVCDYLELLSPDIVIQRLTADGPSDLLIAPAWAMEKKRAIDAIEKELLKRDTRQGARASLPDAPHNAF